MTKERAMTTVEFRALVRTYDLDLSEIAELAGFAYRTVRAYFYGERKVPQPVADLVTSMVYGRRNTADSTLQLVLAVKSAMASAQKVIQDDHAALRRAVEAMCRACEPDGICRQADCPLRPVTGHLRAKGRAA